MRRIILNRYVSNYQSVPNDGLQADLPKTEQDGTEDDSNPPEPRIRMSKGDPEDPYFPPYPRINSHNGALDYHTFRERFRNTKRGESRSEGVVIRGIFEQD